MSAPLTIAQVCADRGIAPGGTKGAARHLAGVAGALARRGETVTTYTARAPIGPHPVPVSELSALAESRPDVVYERYSLSSGFGLEHARSVGAAFVLEVNAPLVEEALRHRPGTVDAGALTREVEMLVEADVVIAVSRPLARWIGQVRHRPTVVIPNGFEPGWFLQAADHESDEQRLVFLGHPKPWHGADRIPNLIVGLNRLGHQPTVQVIGGGDGADELSRRARALGVAAQLDITGAVAPDEASRLVADATIGLAPYPTQEHFYFSPLKVLDYLAAGLAIVSTNQGDLADLVGDAGVIVDDPDDDDTFTRAVADLLEQPERRARMGRSGRERAFTTMTWDHVALQTITAIHLAQPNARRALC